MKKWYESKTIIVNIIAAALGVIPLIDLNLLTAIGVDNTTKYLAIVGTVTTILNVILRAITTKGIGGVKAIAQEEIILPKPPKG